MTVAEEVEAAAYAQRRLDAEAALGHVAKLMVRTRR